MPDPYLLDRTQAEYDRLRRQAQAWEPATRALLDDAGLAPGMRCLDAGCGPGEAMRLMGRTVGPEGHVTGLDSDGVLGRTMLDALTAAEGPRFSFVEADLMAGDPVPGAPFDLVLARLLLLHMLDPVATVRRLAALLRPGGRLVLMDYDMSRLAARPSTPAAERAFAILTETFTRAGKSADAGLQLPVWLAAAGLPGPRGIRADAVLAPMDRVGPMLRGVLASLATPAIALGVTTAEELATVVAGLEAQEPAGGVFGLLPLMIGVWTEV